MKLRSRIGFKAVAFILVFAIAAALISVRFNVIAFEDYVPTVGNEAVPDLSYIETEAESVPDALFEVSDSRSSNSKTLRFNDGSMLLCDKWGNEYIEYFYDASGSPYALRYFNGTSYAKNNFVKNAEGDILELRNTANTLVATYIYDGWGKLASVKDGSGNAITSQTHIANLNIQQHIRRRSNCHESFWL